MTHPIERLLADEALRVLSDEEQYIIDSEAMGRPVCERCFNTLQAQEKAMEALRDEYKDKESEVKALRLALLKLAQAISQAVVTNAFPTQN